jgi:hypothetical protein
VGTISADITTTKAGVSTRDYGFVDMDTSTDCGSHIVGQPSSVQIIQFAQMGQNQLYSGGSYKLSLDGYETTCIAHDATAKDVQDALAALPNIVSSGDDYVTSGGTSSVSVELVDLHVKGFSNTFARPPSPWTSRPTTRNPP